MSTRNTIHSFSKADVRSLLDKVKIFNSRIGNYQKHHFEENGNCNVFLNNGSIFFTTDELQANERGQLEFAMMVQVTGRFTEAAEK